MRGPNRSSCVFVGWALLFAASLHAEIKVLKNFTLIDGTGRPAAAASAMIVDNGRIRWVGAVRDLKAPASAQVIDLSGKYVMPGLINLHCHIGDTSGLQQNASFFTPENVEKDLKTFASYGVTTVLSLGTDKDSIFAIRDGQRKGRPSEARVFTAGQGFVFQGGYGGLDGINKGISSVSEVDAAVAAQGAKHVDVIKLWLDDHLGTKKKMPYDMAKAIIDSGHKRHLKVIAHIFYLKDAQQMVDDGVDGLAHSVRDQPVNDAYVRSMKEHGTWQMAATLSREASLFAYAQTPAFLSDPFFTRAVSPQVLSELKSPKYQQTAREEHGFAQFPQYLHTAEENLKKLADAGVKYGFGTDSGPPGRFEGFAEHWELELMVQAGLTPMQVLTAATGSAAQFLGASDLGTLQPNKWADLVVLTKNPLDSIKNSRTIEAVYVAGNRVD